MPKSEDMTQKLWTGRKLPLVTHCGALLAEVGFLPKNSAMVEIYKNTLIDRHIKNNEDE